MSPTSFAIEARWTKKMLHRRNLRYGQGWRVGQQLPSLLGHTAPLADSAHAAFRPSIGFNRIIVDKPRVFRPSEGDDPDAVVGFDCAYRCWPVARPYPLRGARRSLHKSRFASLKFSMPRPQPVLVYSKYVSDLARFQRLLSIALPDVEIHYAGSATEATPQLERAQILYGWGFSADLLRRMPNLRWVQKMGAGVDDLVGEWPLGSKVVLTRTDGRLIGTRMVEYVVAAILDKTSRFDVARRLQSERRWEYFEVGSIQDLCIGVAGLGEIGSEIGRVLRDLGADVIGWRRSPVHCPSVRQVFVGLTELHSFVRECDALVLALPLTQETRNLFDAEVLGHCRIGVHLINVGRGAVLEENALLDACETGRVGNATLDVFAEEPLPETHPFWSHPQITITPHICGPLIPEKIVPHFLKNYAAFETGTQMQHVVDVSRQY